MRILVAIHLLILCGSCTRENEHATSVLHAGAHRAAAPSEASSEKPDPAVRTIDLPRYQVELPPGAGRDTFAVSCLSCHSARYIGMQPPLSQAKWDEEVHKMIKTYGAPIAEEQVPVLVKYVMDTREHGKFDDLRDWSTLSRAAGATPIPGKIEPASDPAQRASDLEHGMRLFATLCATCHGENGSGKISPPSRLLPPPTDLTARRFSAAALASVLWNGVPGTAMPSYRALKPSDLQALATYMQKLEPPATGVQSSSAGQVLYAQNCAVCHGATGAGDGIAAAALAPRPTDFTNVQPTESAAASAIANGIPGTGMTQWRTKLTPDEQRMLIDYVRSLYAPQGAH